MDLDLAQVRAFTAAAEELHFGRAAARLAISQQALSKRVARLEAALGARLLDRDAHGVGLTPAGRRFLEPARRLLVHGDRAVAAVACARRPLRIDVWGHLYAPMRTVARAVEGCRGWRWSRCRDGTCRRWRRPCCGASRTPGSAGCTRCRTAGTRGWRTGWSGWSRWTRC
ncbi:LysR family transcriptional regulator [Kitasatospora aburaviensis]